MNLGKKVFWGKFDNIVNFLVVILDSLNVENFFNLICNRVKNYSYIILNLFNLKIN